MVRIAFFISQFGPIRRLSAGRRPFGAHTDLLQHLADAVADIEIIVHHQSAEAVQLFYLFRIFFDILQFEAKLHLKCASFANLALHGDHAVHHLHDIFRNRHA